MKPGRPKDDFDSLQNPAKSSSSHVFWYEVRRIVAKGKGVFQDVVTCPPVLFGAGNCLLAYQTAEPLGIVINVLTSLVAASCRIYESWTGIQKGLPYYVAAAVNLATSLSVIYNGFHVQGINGAYSFNERARMSLLSATAFAGWGIGHILKGLHDAKQTPPRSVLDDEQLYYGIGDVAALQGLLVPSIPSLFGIVRAFHKKTDIPQSGKPLWKVAIKNATSARFYAAGFFLGSISAIAANPLFSLAQVLWGSAYICMEKNENRQLLSDFRKLISRYFYSK
jgi:hypothetical protein